MLYCIRNRIELPADHVFKRRFRIQNARAIRSALHLDEVKFYSRASIVSQWHLRSFLCFNLHCYSAIGRRQSGPKNSSSVRYIHTAALGSTACAHAGIDDSLTLINFMFDWALHVCLRLCYIVSKISAQVCDISTEQQACTILQPRLGNIEHF